jgi:histidyl-tRNA synthetase
MARTASLSGFPEWLPEERLVEQHVLDTLRRTFELHGFSAPSRPAPSKPWASCSARARSTKRSTA